MATQLLRSPYSVGSLAPIGLRSLPYPSLLGLPNTIWKVSKPIYCEVIKVIVYRLTGKITVHKVVDIRTGMDIPVGKTSRLCQNEFITKDQEYQVISRLQQSLSSFRIE